MPPETAQTTEQTGTQGTQEGTQTSETTQSQGSSQQQTEQSDGKASEGKSLLTEGDEGAQSKDTKESKSTGAPDKYEAFKAPASWAEKGLELDSKSIEAFIPIAKELGLTQEGAQRLVDFYTSIAEANSDAAMQTVADMRKEWRDQVSADKNVGHRLPEVKKGLADMLGSLGDANLVAQFKEAMDLTGAGDHPAFIRAVDLWSKRFVEGTHVQGNGPSPGGQKDAGAKPASAAKALYPNNP